MLERIIAQKKCEVEELRVSLDIDQVSELIRPNRPRIFNHTPNRVAVIAELKKASPVKGLLCADYNLPDMALSYAENGAAVISVLTDKEFFQGSSELLPEVRSLVQLPLLRKDFIIDELQLYESLLLGADLILLIAAVHNYERLLDLTIKCRELGMEPLLEVHDREELKKALDLPVRMMGVNNRNLKDFTVDIKTSLKLAEYIPDNIGRVSESGIRTAADMRLLGEHGYQAALIGEALVTSPNPGMKLRELVNYDQG